MADNSPWYVTAFNRDYLDRYANRSDEQARDEAAWAAERVGLSDADTLLDLCCGAGRHCRALAAYGAMVTGFDLSADLLDAAERAPAPDTIRNRIRYVRGDMRTLPFPNNTFTVVTSFFTSFGYFDTDEENATVLDEVARVLAPAGTFIIDYLNVPAVLKNLEAHTIGELNGKRIEQIRSYDPSRKRLEKLIRVEGEPDRLESLRTYDPDEFIDLIESHGITVTDHVGSFDGARYDRDTSPRLIVVGRKDGNASPPPSTR